MTVYQFCIYVLVPLGALVVWLELRAATKRGEYTSRVLARYLRRKLHEAGL